ncbi:olfactory receptor 1L4-like [Pelodytes ibericus]
MDKELASFSPQNNSYFSGFILLCFADLPFLHYPLLVIFILIYAVVILGNSLILALVLLNPTLHSPMYFFLCNLALQDICYTTVTLPNLIRLQSQEDKTIYFAGCISQQYFYISFAVSEYFLLAAMAYDRYVAICNPMHYSVVMNWKICLILAKACWLIGFFTPSFPVSFSFHLSFCGSRVINHFFCDLSAMVKLSCSNIKNLQAVIFTESVIFGLLPFVFTLSSYVGIVRTILNISSEKGRYKTFSTCASHLIAVVLFYGIMTGVYMRPSSMYSPANDKLFAILYTAVIPMLNPIIYTLRNREVINVLLKCLNQIYSLRV